MAKPVHVVEQKYADGSCGPIYGPFDSMNDALDFADERRTHAPKMAFAAVVLTPPRSTS